MGISLFELAEAMIESDEFAWSDEGKILRIEEKHNMLSLEVRKADFLYGTIAHYCSGGKIRGRFINEDRHCLVSWLIRKYENNDLKDILNKAKIFFQAPAIKGGPMS